MRNLVRLVSSRNVHQGNLVRLREDRVVLPQGTEAIYEFVEIKHGSSVLAMEENGPPAASSRKFTLTVSGGI